MKKLKCENKGTHRDHPGRTLAFVHDDAIYLFCKDRKCKRWNKIQFFQNGRPLQIGKCAMVQKAMPANYHFDAIPASVVIDE